MADLVCPGQPGGSPGRAIDGRHRQPKRLPPYMLDARRRYFLKNHGPLYAAAVDACMILGLSFWRLRVLLTGKEDLIPPHLLGDSIRHSVFLKGFRVTNVKNPALASANR